MDSKHFTYNGELDGVKFSTVNNNGRYTTVFGGQGLEGTFNYGSDELNSNSNPLEVLRTKLFAHDLPSQGNYDYHKVFQTSTYFV